MVCPSHHHEEIRRELVDLRAWISKSELVFKQIRLVLDCRIIHHLRHYSEHDVVQSFILVVGIYQHLSSSFVFEKRVVRRCKTKLFFETLVVNQSDDVDKNQENAFFNVQK